MDAKDLQLAAAISRLEKITRNKAFNPKKPELTPTPEQQRFLDDISTLPIRYAVGGNQSGKSQLGAREVSWVFTDSHPTFKRPERWGTGKIQILVMGRTMKQVMEVIIPKLEEFLDKDEYKLVNQGNIAQKMVHKSSGNTIIFMSHHGANEAREKAQAFSAQYVWLDEMPSSIQIVEELQRRVQTTKGRFIATFTPKSVNLEIKKQVDASKKPYAEKYKLLALDNPTLDEFDRQSLIDSLKTKSEAERNNILNGDWLNSDDSVYDFDESVIEMPYGYSPLWRHVEAVDPSAKCAGYLLMAECPASANWYIVKAEYLRIPNLLEQFQAVMNLSHNHNIVKRVCDSHETFYLNHASTMKIKPAYTIPYNKTSRKSELIAGLQVALKNNLKISPNCDKLITEIEDCRWSDKGDQKIVNSSSYHLLDCAQYAVDVLPRAEIAPNTQKPWYQDLREKDMARRKAESVAKQKKQEGRVTYTTRILKSKKKQSSRSVAAKIFGKILENEQ